jgi:steroid 5-alpha reductase family enzyme
MTVLAYFVAALGAVLLYMTALFALALDRKDNSVVDVGWGPGFVIVWAITLLLEPGTTPLQVIVGALVGIWASRLAYHIYTRNRGRGEDPRYAAMRKRWGRHVRLRSYFQVFLLQGFLLIIVAAPVIILNHAPVAPPGVIPFAGIVIWMAGFAFESVGDAQLARFKRDPLNRGRLMTGGLWAYTRHPNYFGEAVMWWGIAVAGLSVPGGWAGLAGPMALTFLLTRVSGIPLLEKKYKGDTGFEAYARRTSAFIPLPPKREAGHPR